MVFGLLPSAASQVAAAAQPQEPRGNGIANFLSGLPLVGGALGNLAQGDFGGAVEALPFVGGTLGGLLEGNLDKAVSNLPIVGYGLEQRGVALRDEGIARQENLAAAREERAALSAEREREYNARIARTAQKAAERAAQNGTDPETLQLIRRSFSGMLRGDQSKQAFEQALDASGGDFSAAAALFDNRPTEQASRVQSVQQAADGSLFAINRDGTVEQIQDAQGNAIVGRLPVAVRNVGGVPTAISGGAANNVTAAPLSSLPAEVDAAAAIAGAEAGAKELAQATAKTQFSLPQAKVQVDSAIEAIDNVIADPALKAAFGIPNAKGAAQGGFGNLATIPGTPAADAVVRLKNIQGKVFKEAFETLKGGGSITEREGQAATEAIANLDRAQSYGAAVKELRTLRNLLSEMYAARAKQAGQQESRDFRLQDYSLDELKRIRENMAGG